MYTISVIGTVTAWEYTKLGKLSGTVVRDADEACELLYSAIADEVSDYEGCGEMVEKIRVPEAIRIACGDLAIDEDTMIVYGPIDAHEDCDKLGDYISEKCVTEYEFDELLGNNEGIPEKLKGRIRDIFREEREYPNRIREFIRTRRYASYDGVKAYFGGGDE